MRSAWNVLFAGLPPVRRAGAGIASRMSSTRRADVSNGAFAALAHDRRDDPGREPFLAVDPQDPGEVGRGVGVEHLGRGDPPGGVHPHVQRRVLAVREAAAGLVQLQRRHAEVEQHAVDRREIERVQDPRQLVVDRVHEVRPAGMGREPVARERERLRVAVDPDERHLRKRLEHGFGVPAEAEGGVDVHGARTGQRGTQQLEAPLEQYGYVNPPRHGRPPHAARIRGPDRVSAQPEPGRARASLRVART